MEIPEKPGVSFKKTSISKNIEINVVMRKEYFGEEGLFSDAPSEYSIVCGSMTGSLLYLSKKELRNMIFIEQSFFKMIKATMEERHLFYQERIDQVVSMLGISLPFLSQLPSLQMQTNLRYSKIKSGDFELREPAAKSDQKGNEMPPIKAKKKEAKKTRSLINASSIVSFSEKVAEKILELSRNSKKERTKKFLRKNNNKSKSNKTEESFSIIQSVSKEGESELAKKSQRGSGKLIHFRTFDEVPQRSSTFISGVQNQKEEKSLVFEVSAFRNATEETHNQPRFSSEDSPLKRSLNRELIRLDRHKLFKMRKQEMFDSVAAVDLSSDSIPLSGRSFGKLDHDRSKIIDDLEGLIEKIDNHDRRSHSRKLKRTLLENQENPYQLYEKPLRERNKRISSLVKSICNSSFPSIPL